MVPQVQNEKEQEQEQQVEQDDGERPRALRGALPPARRPALDH